MMKTWLAMKALSVACMLNGVGWSVVPFDFILYEIT
jgi:hypothetical protein